MLYRINETLTKWDKELFSNNLHVVGTSYTDFTRKVSYTYVSVYVCIPAVSWTFDC